MIKQNNFLLLGSSGRNSGKTLFACELIKRIKETQDVVGVKVTAIDKRNQVCPRGGKGCGICSSLKKNWEIVEETNKSEKKDTERMLSAGAKKVFWLRCLRSHLMEGTTKLLEYIPKNTCVICESNSVRSVLEPGLLLVLRPDGETSIKESCKKIIDHADRIITFDGKSFTTPINDISFKSTWKMPEPASAIILAGGKSKRMGKNKSLLRINGTTLIGNTINQLRDNFRQLIISTDNPANFNFNNIDIVPDRGENHGPLMGIATGLEASQNDLNFIVACDIPYIKMNFVRKLLSVAERYDAVVPITPKSHLEPLFAVYRKSVTTTAKKFLKEGKFKISEVYQKLKVNYLKTENFDWYQNINTQQDYEAYLRRISDQEPF